MRALQEEIARTVEGLPPAKQARVLAFARQLREDQGEGLLSPLGLFANRGDDVDGIVAALEAQRGEWRQQFPREVE